MRVDFTQKAVKQFRKLSLTARQAVATKIRAIENVQRFSEIKSEKLSGGNNLYKIRSGNYRIVFQKISSEQILITAIAHRKDIYNKLFGLTFSL